MVAMGIIIQAKTENPIQRSLDILNIDIMFSEMKNNKTEKPALPSWHRKAQKAYRVNRVIIILQMIAALILGALVWFGVNNAVS